MRATASKWAVPTLAALGLADSTYLAVLHWLGEVPPCGGYSGCAAVNSSAYAELFGIPVAACGAALYAALLGLALWHMLAAGSGQQRALLGLYTLSLAGTVFVGYLTAVELFVLRDVCFWCLGLALITALLMALTARDAMGLTGRPATAPR